MQKCLSVKDLKYEKIDGQKVSVVTYKGEIECVPQFIPSGLLRTVKQDTK